MNRSPSPAELAQYLLAPRSVAIVGQSNDAGKTAGRPLKYLRQAGYAGRLYPINPARDTVLGERAWPSLAALPEVPEHVYVVAPTEPSIEAVAEAGRLGVKVATLLADGFAEAGPQGDARVAKLRAICAETGIRVVGPSSLGVVDLRSKALITANAAFDETELPAGRIFAASHSGSMIGALLSRGKARGIGFAGLVSVGNEVDLSLGEICALTLDDPGIDGYMLFLETMRNTAALRHFAMAASERGKPILAYKLGRSAAARELAVTHTGALAGEDDIADAFLAACGIARAETLEGLLEGLPLLQRMPAANATRRMAVGVVTTTGGGATTAIDPLAMRGITIASPSADTLTRLKAAGIDIKPARLVDLTLTGTRYDVMKAALDILTTAPEFDLILCVVGSSARFYPELAVRPIVDSAGKPIAAYLVPDAPQALAMLSRAGVPNFRTPEACADAIAAALRRRKPVAPPPQRDLSTGVATGRATSFPPPLRGRDREGGPTDSESGTTPLPTPPPQGGREQAEFAATAVPSSTREVSPRLIDELEAYELLGKRGLTCAPSLALDADLTTAPALPFAYPVVVKALSAQLAHKSDAGGVVLNVADGAALVAACQRIRANVAAHGHDIARVLVQPMISGVGEVLIGYRVDPDVGPLLMVAMGGTFTEIYRDRSLRLAPVDLATAREMIAEVRGLATLKGFRGKPAGDLDALAQAIVALSQLADDALVFEAEINPLIVKTEGVVAVDAVVWLA
ncbi:MAG TPA: acetate--CoA ligase family protein [Burkholderiales bacterium]|nr:acetate--CoA ligase family protein [Burkholderiales bacterium]